MPAEDRHKGFRRKMQRSSSRLDGTESHGGMSVQQTFDQRLKSLRIATFWRLTVSEFCSRAAGLVGASLALMAVMKTNHSSHVPSQVSHTGSVTSLLVGDYLKHGVYFLYNAFRQVYLFPLRNLAHSTLIYPKNAFFLSISRTRIFDRPLRFKAT